MIDAILGFIFGMSVTGAIWYIRDYGVDSLYLKGYSKGYEKGYIEATADSLKVYEHELEEMKKEGKHGREGQTETLPVLRGQTCNLQINV